MKSHAAWIVGAALLAFAVEGFQDVVGESLSHNAGVSKGLLGIVGGAVFGWLYSWLIEPPKHNPPKTKRPKSR